MFYYSHQQISDQDEMQENGISPPTQIIEWQYVLMQRKGGLWYDIQMRRPRVKTHNMLDVITIPSCPLKGIGIPEEAESFARFKLSVFTCSAWCHITPARKKQMSDQDEM